MPDPKHRSKPSDRLSTKQMAEFTARGFVRLDCVVPPELNERFMKEALGNEIPAIPAGTPLDQAYPEGSALFDIVRLPRVEGLIESLVGPGSIFDHQFVHPSLTRELCEQIGIPHVSQLTHQDSTIDPRFESFDIQLMYYPHDVPKGMGGTRMIPGSHFRRVSEVAIGRYQNILGQEKMVCEGGTICALHHGLWHGGDLNTSDTTRTMYKVRLNPTVKQVRLWDTSDLDDSVNQQRPIFYVKGAQDPEHIHSILTKPEPWFEFDVTRIENINRARFFRALLGDERFDVDYWLTRLDMPTASSSIDN